MTSKKDWIKLIATDEEKALAWSIARQIDKIDKVAQTPILFIPKGKTRLQIIYLGELGNILFGRLLNENSIKYQRYRINLDGRVDSGDFKINGWIIDVKTAQLGYPIEQIKDGYQFFVAEQQMQKDIDYFVSIQAEPDGTTFYIVGFISRAMAMKCPIKQYKNNSHRAYNIPLIDLEPNNILYAETREARNDENTPTAK